MNTRIAQVLLPAFLAMTTSCVPASQTVVRAGLGHVVPPASAATELITPLPLDVAAALPQDDFLSISGRLVPGTIKVIPAAPFVMSERNAGRALECLALTIYHEARSEPEEGQRAVAQVVLNRVRHYAYPSTICGVVYQGSQRVRGCQFTFTCDGSLSGRREQYSWERAKRIAQEALEGYVHSPVGLATHYHTKAVRPYWSSSLRKLTSVGEHIFYRWRGAAGLPSAFVRRSSSNEPAGNPA